jgi:hypothetical protein
MFRPGNRSDDPLSLTQEESVKCRPGCGPWAEWCPVAPPWPQWRAPLAVPGRNGCAPSRPLGRNGVPLSQSLGGMACPCRGPLADGVPPPAVRWRMACPCRAPAAGARGNDRPTAPERNDCPTARERNDCPTARSRFTWNGGLALRLRIGIEVPRSIPVIRKGVRGFGAPSPAREGASSAPSGAVAALPREFGARRMATVSAARAAERWPPFRVSSSSF